MSLQQVRNIINEAPAGLHGDADVFTLREPYSIRSIRMAARKTLALYREASRYSLTEDDWRILRRRLRHAGRRLAEVIESRLSPRTTRRDRQLFHAIAEALGVTLQELQRECVSRAA
jgi:hypothetical protein